MAIKFSLWRIQITVKLSLRRSSRRKKIESQIAIQSNPVGVVSGATSPGIILMLMVFFVKFLRYGKNSGGELSDVV